jgi:hypothetical protein
MTTFAPTGTRSTAASILVVDGKGFLRAVQPLDGETATIGHTDAPRPAQGRSGAVSATDRERIITRLAVLKAAAEFSASKQASSSSDVLLIAAAWERWVLRENTAEEDNVDAF